MSPPLLRFGPLTFHPETADLVHDDGRRVRLRRQPALLLTLLLTHADRVVSRESIARTLWPSDVYVDQEGGINFVVGQLRRALAEIAGDRGLIETLPTQGYRLISPVVGSSTERAEIRAVDGSIPQARGSVWISAACAVAVAGLIVVVAMSSASVRKPKLLIEIRTDAATAPLVDAAVMTDALVAALTAAPAQRVDVVAPQVAAAYEGVRFPLVQRALGLDLYLHASFRALAGHIRLHAKLVRARTGVVVWSRNEDLPPAPLSSAALVSTLAAAIGDSVRRD